MISILLAATLLTGLALGQQCYYGPGLEGPANLVSCGNTEAAYSSCCLLGSTCLSGNACWDGGDGGSRNTYQYGCTDPTYTDESCPFKCGVDSNKTQWVAMNFCNDIPDVNNTWACQGPDSCDNCNWESETNPFHLPVANCIDMGDLALAALHAPNPLAEYVQLPMTTGGSTGYFSGTTIDGASTWVGPIDGYTPTSVTPLATYALVTTSEVLMPGSSPAWTPTSTSSSTTSAATTSPPNTTIVISSPNPSSTTSSEPNASSGGLSKTEVTAIGIGVGVLLLLITAAGVTWYLKRRARRRRQSEKPLLDDAAPHGQVMEMLDRPLSPNGEVLQRKGPEPQTEVVELPSRMSATELPTRMSVIEMDGEHVYEADGVRREV